MSAITCVINHEDNPAATYKPGDTVKGEVKLTLPEIKKVRGISLTIAGYSSCRWYYDSDLSLSRQYSEEKYMKSVSYLLGSATGPDIHLQAGVHSYVFSCTLPIHLPSSFEGKHGYVRYTITVEIKRTWNFDESFKSAFNVVSPLVLALDPVNLQPVKREVSKTFWKLPWASGTFKMIVEIPFKGYVPGETINISVRLQNSTIFHLHDLKFSLKKFTSFHTDYPRRKTKTEELILVENHQRNIASHMEFIEHRLIVPAVPPSNLLHCRIIDIHYYLRVLAKKIGILSEIEVILPIIIGTVRELPTGNATSATPVISASAISHTSSITDINAIEFDYDPPPYDEFPPSYSQAVSTSTRNEIPSSNEKHYSLTSKMDR